MGEKIDTSDNEHGVSIPIQNFFLINIGTFVTGLFPSSLLIFYYRSISKFIRLNSLFGLTSSDILGIEDFWTWFFFPLWLLFCAVLCIYMMGLISGIMDFVWNKKSPPVEGLFIRTYDGKDIVDDRLKYYNLRGFVIKWPLWLATKSPFPWLGYWILRFVGHNKINKNAIYLEAFPSLEFSEIDENVLFMPGSMASSHVVDNLYGNLTIERVRVEKNSTMTCNSILAPGSHILEGTVLMPSAFAIKKWTTKADAKFYSGTPARSIEKRYSGIFSILPEKLSDIYHENGFLTAKDIDDSLVKDL